MPIRNEDPFTDPLTKLNPNVNAYVHQLSNSAEEGLAVSYGPALRTRQGGWRQLFTPQPKQLVVEIGCHKGKVLSQMAADHAEIGFVGFDITLKRVVETARRAMRAKLLNLHVVLANAKQIDRLFAKAEVDGFVVFFPDPWNKKKKQLKNRLLSDAYIAKLYDALKPGGFLWFKSDDESYYSSVSAGAEKAGFALSHDSQPHGWLKGYESSFEVSFSSQGVPCHQGLWYKVPR